VALFDQVEKASRGADDGLDAGGLTIGMAGSASATLLPPPPGLHEIASTFIHVNPDGTGARECLDVVDGSTSVGARLQIFHCHGSAPNGAPQLFAFLPENPDTFQITNEKSSLCLAPDPGARPPENFADIKQERCIPGPSQSWQFDQIGSSSSLHIRNIQTNLCLGAFTLELTDHNPVVLQNCDTFPELVAFHIS
jgi:hypothetical protein